MPFDKAFDDVYQIGIKESCREVGVYCERVDEQIFHERILDRIYNQIAKADCIIADMTGRNPNVFYEVGYAHALGKPTILLTQRADDIPFDLKHFPHIVYEARLVELREQLSRRVRWFVENRPTGIAELRDPFELFMGSKRMTSEPTVEERGPKALIGFAATLRNATTQVLEPGKLKAAVLTRPSFKLRTQNVTSTTMADGRSHHLLPDFPALFPDEVTPVAFWANHFIPQIDEEMTVRIYTEAGPRDFPMIIRPRRG